MKNSKLFSTAAVVALVLVGCNTPAPTSGPGAAPVSASEQAFIASDAVSPHYKAMLASGDDGSTGQLVPVTATAVSSTRPGIWFVAANLTDGNLHSAWGPEAGDATPTVTLDLASCTTVRGLGLKQSGGATFDVAVSTNGGDFKVIATHLSSQATVLDRIDLTAAQADRVQLRFHPQDSLLVCEVQVFGDARRPTRRPRLRRRPAPSLRPRRTPAPRARPIPAPRARRSACSKSKPSTGATTRASTLALTANWG